MKTKALLDPKQQILDAAIHLFARKGFSATGVREIAYMAHVNIAMISYYFGSKRGILEAVLDIFFQRYREVVERALCSDTPLEQKMRYFIRSIVTLFRDNTDLVRIACTELPYDVPEIAEFKSERVKKIATLIQRELLPILEERLPRPIRIEIVGPAFIGMVVFHFLLLPVLKGVFSTSFDDSFYEQYPDEIANLLLYGVLSKDVDPRATEDRAEKTKKPEEHNRKPYEHGKHKGQFQ